MGYKTLKTERFLQMVYELYFGADKRFCFVLGSGASRNSGIRTATELMAEWLDYLRQLPDGMVQDAANSIKLDNYQRFLSPDYSPDSNDYFSVFELRFADMPEVAYKTLEREMSVDTRSEEEISEQLKFPSYGYLCLACLLADSENRYVITTNFDPMLEEALSVCRGVRPLVIGHESLARFMDRHANRPVILKVHRDLMYQPMNTREEMKVLKEEWKEPLTSVLLNSIPIVIGYAGADQTLMTFLENNVPEKIFWCGMDDKPTEQVQKLLDRSASGFWVKIDGFDDVAFRMGKKFLEQDEYRKKYKEPEDFIKSRSDRLLSRYIKQKNELSKSDFNSIGKAYDSDSQSKQDLEERAAKAKSYADLTASDTDTAEVSNTDVMYKTACTAFYSGDYQKALDILNDLVQNKPDNAEYWNSRGVTLHKMKRYDEALKDKTKAVELEPDNAGYWNSHGVTLHEMKRYDEALKDKTKAVELEPDNARYWNNRGVTLHEMKRYDDALKDKTKAVELEPDNARYWNNRGVTLHEMKHYDEALKDKTKAVELEPDNAGYWNSRGVTLHEMKHYDEALKDLTKAIEADSTNTEYWRHRSIVFRALGRDADADADEAKAKELESQTK